MALYSAVFDTTTTAAATKSMWLLNPLIKKIKLVEYGISFDGSSPAESIKCALYRIITLGSPVGTAFTPVPYDPDEQASTTGCVIALTTEPTSATTAEIVYVSPYGGLFVKQFPLGREFCANETGLRIGFRVITPAGVNPDAEGYVVWEE